MTRFTVGTLILPIICLAVQARGANAPLISGRAADDIGLVTTFRSVDIKKIISPDLIWIVGKVTLDPGSYETTLSLDRARGPGAQLVESKEFVKGNCQVLAKLTGDFGKDQWSFNWEDPYDPGVHFGPPEPAGESGPKVHAGVSIIRLDPTAQRDFLFATTYELPDEKWAPYAAEWVEFYRQHTALFTQADAAQNKDALAGLADGDNPLLALEASRVLLKAKMLSPELTQAVLKKSPFLTQAVLVIALLEATTKENLDITYKAIDATIASLKDVSEIEGIACGAMDRPRDNDPGKELSKRIMNRVSKRLPSLKGDDEIRQCVKRFVDIYNLASLHP